MSMTEEQMLKAMQQSNEDLVKKLGIGGSTGGGGGGSSGGSGDAPSLKKVDGVIATLIGSFTKLNSGASASGMALEGFAGALNKIPLAGSTLSTAFGSMAGVAQENIAGQKALRDSGISFNNNMADYAQTVGRSGQTNKEFERMMTSMAPSLSGVGANMGASAKNVAKFNEDLQKSDVGQKLLAMGYNTDEVNRFGAIALANSKQRDLSDSKQRAEAVQAAGELITKNQALAAATGKSTDEINKLTMANSANIDMQAEILAGGPETQAAYSKLLPTLNELGPTISNMAQEAFSETGIKSEEAGNTYAVLGSAGQQLQEAIQMQKEASKEGATLQQKQAADAAMERAKTAIDQRMMTKEFRDLVQNPSADGGVARKMFADRQQQLGSLQQAQTQLKKQGQPSGVGDARQFQQNLNAASMMSVDPATGKRSQGADVVQAQNQADIAGRAAANKVAISGINSLGKAADNAARKINAGLGGGVGKVNTPAKIIDDPKSVAGGAGRTPPKDPGRMPQRALGTEGALSMPFEPSDFIGKIHKGENVLKAEDAQLWAQAGGSKGVEKMLAGMSKDIGAMVNTSGSAAKLPPPSIDMSKINDMIPKPSVNPINVNDILPKTPVASAMATPKPSANIAAPTDFFSSIKSKVSAMTKDIMPSKSKEATPKTETAKASAETETPKAEAPAAAGETFNTDVLFALNSLNKLMGQLVSHSETSNTLTESMTRKMGSDNRFAG